MIKIEFIFSVEDAIALFRCAGLKVEHKNVKHHFENIPHRPDYFEEVPTWVVTNPNTGKDEELAIYFRRYLELKKQELFLQEQDKLKIYKLFDK